MSYVRFQYNDPTTGWTNIPGCTAVPTDPNTGKASCSWVIPQGWPHESGIYDIRAVHDGASYHDFAVMGTPYDSFRLMDVIVNVLPHVMWYGDDYQGLSNGIRIETDGPNPLSMTAYIWFDTSLGTNGDRVYLTLDGQCNDPDPDPNICYMDIPGKEWQHLAVWYTTGQDPLYLRVQLISGTGTGDVYAHNTFTINPEVTTAYGAMGGAVGYDYGTGYEGNGIWVYGYLRQQDTTDYWMDGMTLNWYYKPVSGGSWTFAGSGTTGDCAAGCAKLFMARPAVSSETTFYIKTVFDGYDEDGKVPTNLDYAPDEQDSGYYDTMTVTRRTPYVRNYNSDGSSHNYGNFYGSGQSTTLRAWVWTGGYGGTPAVGVTVNFYRRENGGSWINCGTGVTNANGMATRQFNFPSSGQIRNYLFRAIVNAQTGFFYGEATYDDTAKWIPVMGYETTNLTVGASTTDPYLEVGQMGDLYMWTTTIAEDITNLNTTGNVVNQYEVNKSVVVTASTLFSQRIGNQWQVVQIIQLPSGLSVNQTAEIKTEYSLLYINGSVGSRSIRHNMTIGDLQRISELGYDSTYPYVQSLLSIWRIFEIGMLSTVEEMVFVNHVRHSYNLLHSLPEGFIEFGQDYSIQGYIDEYLEVFSSENKIALVLGLSDYRNTNVMIKQNTIIHNYLNLSALLEDNGYIVVYLLDEYITTEYVQLTADLIDNFEDHTTSIFFAYIGHINALGEDLNNATQAIVTSDAQLITDAEFSSMVSVWESEHQIFLIDSCHAEGFAYDLQQAGRVIWASSGVAQPDYHDPNIDPKFTAFYYYFINNWDDTASIEANFETIKNVIINDDMNFVPVLFDDDEASDVFL